MRQRKVIDELQRGDARVQIDVLVRSTVGTDPAAADRRLRLHGAWLCQDREGPGSFFLYPSSLGVPAPQLMGWATILIELAGGFAVLAGALVTCANGGGSAGRDFYRSSSLRLQLNQASGRHDRRGNFARLAMRSIFTLPLVPYSTRAWRLRTTRRRESSRGKGRNW